MRYVYLLESESFAGQRYIGMASNLKLRLGEHTQESRRTLPSTLLGDW